MRFQGFRDSFLMHLVLLEFSATHSPYLQVVFLDLLFESLINQLNHVPHPVLAAYFAMPIPIHELFVQSLLEAELDFLFLHSGFSSVAIIGQNFVATHYKHFLSLQILVSVFVILRSFVQSSLVHFLQPLITLLKMLLRYLLTVEKVFQFHHSAP